MARAEQSKLFWNWNNPDPQLLSINAYISGTHFEYHAGKEHGWTLEETFLSQRFVLLKPRFYQTLKRLLESTWNNREVDLQNDSLTLDLSRNGAKVRLEISKDGRSILSPTGDQILSIDDFHNCFMSVPLESHPIAATDFETLFHNLVAQEYRIRKGRIYHGNTLISNLSLPLHVSYAYHFARRLNCFLGTDDSQKRSHVSLGFLRMGSFIFVEDPPPRDNFGCYLQQLFNVICPSQTIIWNWNCSAAAERPKK